MRIRRFVAALLLACLLATALPAAGGAAAKYYITVDVTNQIVTVYDNGDTSESGIVCQMICSTGKSGTPTPTGTYVLPVKTYASERQEWYYFPKYNCYAKWATRIVGGILFHSVLYTAGKVGPTRSSLDALGSRASHGCVRLRVADARWIALNCPAGTRCKIYSSGRTNTDLRRRLLSRSFYRSSETYGAFMGREVEELTRGMRGEYVRQLQGRLKALGFLDDVVDGIFGANTENAVKYFQKACGLKRTGRVDKALWKRAFADDAPTGTYVALSEGMEGPAVAALQRALQALKLYGGAADGRYTAAVTEAVRAFRAGFGYAAGGAADQALQNDALKRAAALRERFGGGDYRLVTTTQEQPMARVTGRSVGLYAEAKTSSTRLATLKRGAEVELLSRAGSWSRVRSGKKTGYMRNKYLEDFTRTQVTLTYEPIDAPTPEVTPTPTPEVFIPTPTPEVTPTPTPEIFIPTSTPEAAPTPTPVIFIPTPTPGAEGEDPVRAALEEAPVAEVEEELAAPQSLSKGAALVLRDGAGLYARPGDAEPMLALDEGEVLAVTGVWENWVAVRRGDADGYVAAMDVVLTDALPTPEPFMGAVPNEEGGIEPGAEPTPRPEATVAEPLEIDGR